MLAGREGRVGRCPTYGLMAVFGIAKRGPARGVSTGMAEPDNRPRHTRKIVGRATPDKASKPTATGKRKRNQRDGSAEWVSANEVSVQRAWARQRVGMRGWVRVGRCPTYKKSGPKAAFSEAMIRIGSGATTTSRSQTGEAKTED